MAKTQLRHFEYATLSAQASETSTPECKKFSKGEIKRNFLTSKPVTSFATNTDISESQVCVLCKSDKHPLFSCSKFKELPHDGRLSVLKARNLCINCL